jgi:hypothetical protein
MRWNVRVLYLSIYILPLKEMELLLKYLDLLSQLMLDSSPCDVKRPVRTIGNRFGLVRDQS